MSTEYRVHSINPKDGGIEVGLIVGKSPAIRFVGVDRSHAWRLAQQLLLSLQHSEHHTPEASTEQETRT